MSLASMRQTVVPVDADGNEAGSWPATDAFSVTPSDTVNFITNARSLYVGTGGTVVIVTPKGSVVSLLNVPDGAELHVCVKRVNATSTTATDIVGFV